MEKWKRGKRELPKTNKSWVAHSEKSKSEQWGDEMGNTEFTFLFGKSPPKKYPHPLQGVNLFP